MVPRTRPKFSATPGRATLLWLGGACLLLSGCQQAKPAGGLSFGAGGPMPVQTVTVAAHPVAQSDEYVATIKSRRSATINPQVDGNLTSIAAHAGEHVKQGQLLMQIDPVKQRATLQAQAATEQQKLAVYQFNQTELARQRKLFEAGITSRDAFDQAQQAFNNAKADYESSVASRETQSRQLSYYSITAPFDGVVGDIPVHVGDYVSSTTTLTTVDENRDLEAYIYIPTERAALLRTGLGVDILNSAEEPVEHTAINFLSPQVDNSLQGILAKAPVRSGAALLRTAQLVKARVIWSEKPTPVVPVLAVTRLGGQAFVYVVGGEDGKFVARQKAIQLGDTVGNEYAVLSGLTNGERVIVSGTQMLVDGAPVQPLPAQPAS
ncbi:MAG TPA: efflux RND transporter periplasmic adaptor subunit [Acidobacteriaceae bacterium]